MLGAELDEFLGGGAHVEVSVDDWDEQRGDTRRTTAERRCEKISRGIGEYLYAFAHEVMTNGVSVSVITALLVGPDAPMTLVSTKSAFLPHTLPQGLSQNDYPSRVSDSDSRSDG
jgi:hypothetical protein